MALDAKLWCPSEVYINKRPPVPQKITISFQVSAFMTNKGSKNETLIASTPCDVHNWRIMNSAEMVMATEPAEFCIEMLATRQIAANETIRSDNQITLDAVFLQDGEQYTVKYKFWGYDCEDTFTARVLV